MKNPIANITNGSLTRKGSKKSISRRGLLAAPLLIAIVALAFVALTFFTAPAQAQTVTTLVSNYASKTTNAIYIGGTDSSNDFIRAQKFETGAHAEGYTLQTVKFSVEGTPGDNINLVVSVYSTNADGDPDTQQHVLTGTLAAGENVFTAPANTVLATSTSYFIHFEDTEESTPHQELGLFRVNDSDEDTALTGWSLAAHYSYNKAGTTGWQSDTNRLVAIDLQGFAGLSTANTAPTASNGSVLTSANVAYTFAAADFNFADTDSGDTLEKVKIVTLPTAGTLALDGSNVSSNDEITKAKLDADSLVFTPATDGTGKPYATFTFKVNDGDDESASAYTMSVNVDAACAEPTHTGDHTQIWSGALTVGSFISSSETFYGFNSDTDPDTGALDPSDIPIAGTDYPATTVVVQGTGTNAGILSWVFGTAPSEAEVNSITLHVCDTGFPLRDFTGRGSGRYSLANSGLDWSAVTARTLYISRDTAIPTLESAVVDGASLTLTYNEDLYEGGLKSNVAFDITIGTASAVNPSSFTISEKEVTLTLPTAALATDTVTLAYTKPATTTQRVQDLAANEAVALSSQAVTNETDVADSTDATLSAITVSPGTVHGFAADRTSYEVGVASTVTQTTITPTTTDDGAEVEITPADADGATGHQVDLSAGQNTVTILVTAEDDTATETYTVNINRGVTTPTGWKASDDFDTLVAAENNRPTATWSDGTTLWVVNDSNTDAGDKIYAYTLATKARDATKDFDTLDAADNNRPTGLWSDGTTMWVADGQDIKIYAYTLATKARDATKDFDTLRRRRQR